MCTHIAFGEIFCVVSDSHLPHPGRLSHPPVPRHHPRLFKCADCVLAAQGAETSVVPISQTRRLRHREVTTVAPAAELRAQSWQSRPSLHARHPRRPASVNRTLPGGTPSDPASGHCESVRHRPDGAGRASGSGRRASCPRPGGRRPSALQNVEPRARVSSLCPPLSTGSAGAVAHCVQLSLPGVMEVPGGPRLPECFALSWALAVGTDRRD